MEIINTKKKTRYTLTQSIYDSIAGVAGDDSTRNRNHPKSLRVFFATEMWERYGFYVIQTLLALYLAKHFNWNDKDIYALVGSFTALTYVSPVLGGWVADKLLGQKRTIITGGIILFCCYLLLGFIDSNFALLCSLAGISVGTGLFKPNISSLLGNEYPDDSNQRENGFTIFYMGITLGIIFGCTFPNQLTFYFGWPVSFISAAIGMLLGLLVFVLGIIKYQIKDYAVYEYSFKNILLAVLIVMVLWLASFFILTYTTLANFAFTGIVLLSAGYFAYTIKEQSSYDARKTIVISLLCIISIIFWAFYFQMFLSFTLFIARVVKQDLFGLHFPPPYYVSIQSFGAIVFGLYLSRRKYNTVTQHAGIQSANKFLLSMCFMTAAFLSLTFICKTSENDQLLSPLLFIPIYLMISLAELLLYPIGLSIVTVLAPRKKVSTMTGIFFVSLGVGGFLAGKLAELAAVPHQELSLPVLKAYYASGFSTITCLLIAALFISFILNRLIKRLLSNAPAEYKNTGDHFAQSQIEPC
ncbi:peptide MFS transporter [Legionella sp. 16cNR16C]|uniref:peptide MFS transporter n=1 Tax=Legionella sp. 16cNR16C TaxID=2905656 RepID=UPI001E339AC2|nr:peptide MFS transporter [Legionella sp. 16cNR16C]MCE3043539.1 peptide MFS transporter [Legionella sp. 16cNR16C]